MTLVPQTTIKLFADDCLLHRTFNSVSHETQLEQDIDGMVEWSNTWLMRFNAAKCHLLRITREWKYLPIKYNICGVQLKEFNHHPYVGLNLSQTRPGEPTSVTLTTKANRILNLFQSTPLWLQPRSKIKSLFITCLTTSGLVIIILGPLFQARHFGRRKSKRKGARIVTSNYFYRESYIYTRLSSVAPSTRKTDSPKTDTFL